MINFPSKSIPEQRIKIEQYQFYTDEMRHHLMQSIWNYQSLYNYHKYQKYSPYDNVLFPRYGQETLHFDNRNFEESYDQFKQNRYKLQSFSNPNLKQYQIQPQKASFYSHKIQTAINFNDFVPEVQIKQEFIEHQNLIESQPKYVREEHSFFQNCINELNQHQGENKKIILKKILANQLRKKKVQAYLQKKKIRLFQKKIRYRCRKIVADNRVRFRGRFINISQAIEILGLSRQQNYQIEFLKEQLKRHK